MKRIITYYCDECKKCVDFERHATPLCKCGKLFGVKGNISDYINMRKTWSGQTKIEFSTTTIDQDIADRNKR
jgi:hypothetical protein